MLMILMKHLLLSFFYDQGLFRNQGQTRYKIYIFFKSLRCNYNCTGSIFMQEHPRIIKSSFPLAIKKKTAKIHGLFFFFLISVLYNEISRC